MGEIWLRYTVKARRKVWAHLGIVLIGLPLMALGVERGNFWFALAIGGAIVLAAALVRAYEMRPRLYLKGDSLMRRGRSAPVCSLATADAAVVSEPYRGSDLERVWLVLDGFRIRLGDGRVPSYYEPAALLALADGLAKSGYVQPQEVAESLRQLAGVSSGEERVWPKELRTQWPGLQS